MKNKPSLIIQLIAFGIALILGILSFIFDSITPIFIFVTSITLFIMAYNNKKLFKRKHFTALYIIFGIIVLLTAIGEFING